MQKKILKVMLIVFILSFIIASTEGCSGYNKSSDQEASFLNSEQTKKLNEVTLKFYIKGLKKEYAPDVLKEIEKSAYDKLKIKLDFQWIVKFNASYENMMCVKLASNEEFDGFFLSDYEYLPNFNFVEFAKNGYLKDISQLLPKFAPNIYNKLTKEQLNAASYHGKLLAVPNLVPKADVLYAVVREDLIKKYKLPEIKNYSDYAAYLKIVKEKEKSITIPSLVNFMENSLSLFANSCDYSILDEKQQLVYKRGGPNIKVQAWEQTPEFNMAANKLITWKKNGYLDWFGDTDSEDMTDVWIAQKLLSGYSASTLTYNNVEEELNAKSKGSGRIFKAYRLYPDKKLDRKSPINGCIAFKATSKNVERALMFMDWIQSSQKNYDLFMYGRKGIDYELDGSNYILPKKYQSEYECPYLGWQGREAFMNMNYERFRKGAPENSGRAYSEFINSNTADSPCMGFYPDYSNLSFETSDRTFFIQKVNQNVSGGISPKTGIDMVSLQSADESTKTILQEIQGQLNVRNSKNNN